MSPWLDSLSVLENEWRLVITILVCVLASQALTSFSLRNIFGDSLTSAEYLSLGLAGWIVPASILSLVWYFTGFNGIFWILPAALILFLLLRLRSDLVPALPLTSLFLILFLLFSILLRLAYASQATFPLYFDSAQHYLIIKNIIGNDRSWIFNWLTINYYHPGFHFLTAFFASVSHAENTRVMLVLGQMILALIPFPVFFLVRHETKSDMAGWFALVLSAFGWYMPAHAVDWGKYPALMSVGLIPFVLSLAYLIFRQKSGLSAKKRWALHGILGISAVLSVFAHSRTLIVLGIVWLAWSASILWQKLPQRQKTLVFILVVVITLLEVVFIQRQSILVLVFDPYLQKGILVTALVLLLSVFAWMVYPRLTFVSVLAVTFLLGSLFIPVTWIPGYRNLTLLDRPFVEMILFLPLSMLGGLGLAGLQKKLGRFSWSRYVGFLAIGIIVINAFFTYDLYPSDCCVIVGNDDVVAMDWMADQLPVDARIGISSTQLKVMASESSEGDVGADAGIWVTPLTGRVTMPLSNTSEFDQAVTLDRMCELGIGYLFVGEAGQPFDALKILSRPEWYRPLLSMPKTGVYEVIGCQ